MNIRVLYFIVFVAIFSLSAINTYAFRCEGELIQKGDHSVEVLKECGPPLFKDHIGYTITVDKKREMKITDWVYEDANGHTYSLTF